MTSRIQQWFVLCVVLVGTALGSEPVPSHEEPLHWKAFHNAHIRILDVQIPPGKATLYHRHFIPSVIICLKDLVVGSEEWPNQPMSVRQVKAGTTLYAPYHVQPQTHRVTNKSTELFRVLDIEIIGRPSSAFSEVISSRALTEIWNEKLARASKATLGAGELFTAMNRNPCLFVPITGSFQIQKQSQPRVISSGGFEFFEPGKGVSIVAIANSEAVLLELK